MAMWRTSLFPPLPSLPETLDAECGGFNLKQTNTGKKKKDGASRLHLISNGRTIVETWRSVIQRLSQNLERRSRSGVEDDHTNLHAVYFTSFFYVSVSGCMILTVQHWNTPTPPDRDTHPVNKKKKKTVRHHVPPSTQENHLPPPPPPRCNL